MKIKYLILLVQLLLATALNVKFIEIENEIPDTSHFIQQINKNNF